MAKKENEKEIEVLEEKTNKETNNTPIENSKEKIEKKDSKELKHIKPKESKTQKEETKNTTNKEKEKNNKIKESFKPDAKIEQTEEEIALTKELDAVLKELQKESKKEEEKEEKEENMAKKKKKNSKTKKALKKPINIIGLILGILFLISTLLIFGIVTYINILPAKFYTIFAVVFGLFILLVSFMLINVKVKKGLKKTFMGIGLITTIICTIASYYAFQTFGFLQKITNADMSTKEKYYVMVKSDSKYENLSDIKGFSLGTFNENTNIYKDALDKLNKKVEVTLVETESSISCISLII